MLNGLRAFIQSDVTTHGSYRRSYPLLSRRPMSALQGGSGYDEATGVLPRDLGTQMLLKNAIDLGSAPETGALQGKLDIASRRVLTPLYPSRAERLFP